MWTKIFAAALLLCIFILGFITYYSWSWLNSIGLPSAAIIGFEQFDSYGWTFLWISSIALLGLANVILIRTGKAWAMWITFLYFAVFVVAKYFWLAVAATNFQRDSNLPSNNYLLGPFLALFLCIAFGAIVFVNQLLVVRVTQTIYPPEPDLTEEIIMEESVENNDNV